MIDLGLLADGGVGWLDASGPASHLVLSTRIRLARNLASHVFQGRTSETEREPDDEPCKPNASLFRRLGLSFR